MDRRRLPDLARLVYADWEEAPQEMGFCAPWGQILEELADLAARLAPGKAEALERPAAVDPAWWSLARSLYVRSPALVNVVLNWRICIELGLPLHPTRYFEVNAATRGSVAWPRDLVDRALPSLEAAIGAARAVMRLDPEAPFLVEALARSFDPEILGFEFTSVPDKYTWRGCDPAPVLALAGRIEGGLAKGAFGGPTGGRGLVIGAAHGSLIPGLVLAETLGWELWFVRFSMFKRSDREPVLTPSDPGFFAPWAEAPVILFDEDVAKGTTLRIFTETLAPYFSRAKSASVIRHGLAGFRPDFCGAEWFD